MPTNDHLIPVSFHLRNFNKYTKLDLVASQKGNLTLIGENAVGKTTLANCFFPVLIDGSIATPSFNAAKGTDRLDRTGNPRNSRQDTRNFDSMLLGWGAGAMKVRTGYTYMHLKSPNRQVIMGLGAHRVAGSTSNQTWWFLAITDDPDRDFDVVTTDGAGHSLERTAFHAANQQAGVDFELFKQATEYRDQVAMKVYGFENGSRLSQLAAAYRLLASPILTAGNAKFTPIIEALKNAQAGIDRRTVRKIAASQRDVNTTNALLARLKVVRERLLRIRKAVFWRNLNHLEELTLNSYISHKHQLEQQVTVHDTAQQIIVNCDQELAKLQANLHHVTDKLSDLRDALAAQKVIEQQRRALAREIADLNRRIADYVEQQKQLVTLKREAERLQVEQQRQTAARTELVNTALRPTQAQLDRLTPNLPELRAVVTETEFPELVHQLAAYLQAKRVQRTQVEGLDKQIIQGNRDVKIVSEMQTQLDDCIDQRLVGPLSSRPRTGLHEDNQTVHADGASRMDTAVKELMAQRDQLLRAHPDLKPILADESILANLETLHQKLVTVKGKLKTVERELAQLANQLAANAQSVKVVESTMDRQFDLETARAEVAKIEERRDALVIDASLQATYDATETTYDELLKSERQLTQKRDVQKGRFEAAQQAIQTEQTQLDALVKKTEAALTTLQPYLPADCELADIDALLAFVHAHHAEIRTANYSELANYVGAQIHHNDENGLDMNAIDLVFADRGHDAEASQMRQQRTVNENEMTVVAFDINHAIELIETDQVHVDQKLNQLEVGNDAAHAAYMGAAVERISEQYKLIDQYNQILAQGAQQGESIKLKITLTPAEVSDMVIAEARNPRQEHRDALGAEINRRLNKLAQDVDVADDEQAFLAEADRLLDTRQWSAFKVLIKRRQSGEDEYEEVDDKFVQSGGSGAEKAQAMVLPLLLVPKMVLNRSTVTDAPYLVMFDEFADKLDPETAKSFARTIANFGFNFIATMPSGAQNKILADGIDNVAYDVIAPKNQQNGKFYRNVVRPALIWQREAPDESVS